eukprot:4998960-Prorocentrum_lima.AAC.1
MGDELLCVIGGKVPTGMTAQAESATQLAQDPAVTLHAEQQDCFFVPAIFADGPRLLKEIELQFGGLL